MFWPFSLGRKNGLFSQSASKDKLFDYTTILVKIQVQVEREINNSHPQVKTKTTLVIQIHKDEKKHTSLLK